MRAFVSLFLGALWLSTPALAAGPTLSFRQQPSAFNNVNVPFEQAPLLEILGADGFVDIAGEDCLITLTLEAKPPVQLRGEINEKTRGGIADFTGHSLRVSGVKVDDSFRILAKGSGSARCQALSVYSDYFVVSASR